jgi:hypothetical protein
MARAEFILREEHLPLFSWLTGSDSNSISPWKQVEPKEVGAQERQLLTEAGLADERGNLKEDIARVVDMLKKPERFARIRLISGPIAIEQVIYSCGPSGEQVSITPDVEGLLVRYPAPVFVLLSAFMEYLGSSTLVSSSLNMKVDGNTALVFAGLIDLHRRRLLLDRGAMRSSQRGYYSSGDILQGIRFTPSDGQWLVTAIKKFVGEEVSLGEKDVEQSLSKLEQLQLVKLADDAYTLEGEALALGNSFLIISQALHLELGVLTNKDEAVRSTGLCLQAGLHDNLYLDSEGDEIILEAISSSYIGEMMRTFFTYGFDERALAEEKAEPPVEEKAEPPVEEKAEPPVQVMPEEKVEPVTQAAVTEQAAAPVSTTFSADPVQWHIHIRGQRYGPYSRQQLQDFVAQGTLQREDMVWCKGMKEWSKAGAIEGLFN